MGLNLQARPTHSLYIQGVGVAGTWIASVKASQHNVGCLRRLRYGRRHWSHQPKKWGVFEMPQRGTGLGCVVDDTGPYDEVFPNTVSSLKRFESSQT